jgi:hypothetical protein
VQVALDPHPGELVVHPRVVQPGHVVVEQRRRAAIEGERVGCHLAELRAERPLVVGDQLLERRRQHGHDVLLAVLVRSGELLEQVHGQASWQDTAAALR